MAVCITVPSNTRRAPRGALRVTGLATAPVSRSAIALNMRPGCSLDGREPEDYWTPPVPTICEGTVPLILVQPSPPRRWLHHSTPRYRWHRPKATCQTAPPIE